jgi:transketolase
MKIMPANLKMRRCFVNILHEKMRIDERIWVITADLGYKMWDEIKADYPDRFINVGAAEQAMVGLGIGLALEGKIPFVYSITPFLLYRPFESIRNYINNERIPVKLIGAGRNRDYCHDGFSHWSGEDKEIMKILSNIRPRWPEENSEIKGLIEEMIENKNPYYVNLRK